VTSKDGAFTSRQKEIKIIGDTDEHLDVLKCLGVATEHMYHHTHTLFTWSHSLLSSLFLLLWQRSPTNRVSPAAETQCKQVTDGF